MSMLYRSVSNIALTSLEMYSLDVVRNSFDKVLKGLATTEAY